MPLYYKRQMVANDFNPAVDGLSNLAASIVGAGRDIYSGDQEAKQLKQQRDDHDFAQASKLAELGILPQDSLARFTPERASWLSAVSQEGAKRRAQQDQENSIKLTGMQQNQDIAAAGAAEKFGGMSLAGNIPQQEPGPAKNVAPNSTDVASWVLRGNSPRENMLTSAEQRGVQDRERLQRKSENEDQRVAAEVKYKQDMAEAAKIRADAYKSGKVDEDGNPISPNKPATAAQLKAAHEMADVKARELKAIEDVKDPFTGIPTGKTRIVKPDLYGKILQGAYKMHGINEPPEWANLLPPDSGKDSAPDATGGIGDSLIPQQDYAKPGGDSFFTMRRSGAPGKWTAGDILSGRWIAPKTLGLNDAPPASNQQSTAQETPNETIRRMTNVDLANFGSDQTGYGNVKAEDVMSRDENVRNAALVKLPPIERKKVIAALRQLGAK